MNSIKDSSAYQINATTLPLAIVGALFSAGGIFLLHPSAISLKLGTACLALAGLFAALYRYVLPKVKTHWQIDLTVFSYHLGIYSVQWLSLSLSPETESPGGALLICAISGLLFHSSFAFVAAVVFCGTTWLAIRNYLGVPPTPSLLLEFFVAAPVFSAIIRLAVLKTYNVLLETRARELVNVNELRLAATKLAKETQLRQESELRLLHAQKNESLGVLAAGVAHDFNNSLLAISAFAENMQLTTHEDNTKDAATQILKAVQQASRICSQMLTYAGKPTGELNSISLSKLIQDAQPLLQATVGSAVKIEVSCLPQVGAITANETQIQQVIMNLVTNAAEAMSGPGNVVIKVRNVTFDHNLSDVPDDYFGAPINSGKYVQLEVIDDGRGMSEDVLLQVFDPYFTTKQSGHGFGLSTVLGIVRSHKASMSVESQLNHGTTMRVLFPARGMKFADSSQFRTPLGPKITGREIVNEDALQTTKRILVIDDDELVRAPLSRMLTLLGWDVVDSASGVEALAILRGGEKFSALLIDFKMPQLNGQQTLKAIREMGCETPAILCSGFISEPEQASVLADFDDFLPKPFHRRDLEEKLSRLQVDTDTIP